MVYPIYSIRDSLVGYGIPFPCDNDAVAMRHFDSIVKTPGSIYELNKNQFDLYCLGEFDTKSGEIKSDVPRYVCNANDFPVKE